MDWMKKILREIIVFGACAVFTATVGLIVVDQVVMPRYVRQHVQVTVPDLVGLTPAQARGRLRNKTLRMKLQDPRWDPSVPEGHIVSQNPAPNFKVKPNRTVYVVPSLGGRLYTVPDVRNRPLRQAELWIAQADFAIGEVTETPSSRVKEGHVIEQSLPPGTEVDAGTQLDLVISTGPPRAFVDVPLVVELKLEDARQLLATVGLQADNIRYESSTAYEPNVVIRQTPEAGTPIKRGSNVRLVVSKL